MSDLTDIKLPSGTKVTVVGDIHEHEEQFDLMVDKINPCKENLIVLVGDFYDKGFGIKTAESIIRKTRKLVEDGVCFAVKGNHELKHIRVSKSHPDLLTEELTWIETLPLCVSFRFSSNDRLTIVHGGVTPKHNWDDLKNSSDVVYVRTVDESGEYIPLKWTAEAPGGPKTLQPARLGKPWGELYDGRFGYIAAGHDAQKDGIPKFWKHSCNIDTACYHTGILTAQEFTERGLGELIQVRGTSRRWEMPTI